MCLAAQDFPPVSPDTPWVIGDCDRSGKADTTDAILLLEKLFTGRHAPACALLCDFEKNDTLNLTDAILILRHVFLGDKAPALPPIPDEVCDGKDNNCDGITDPCCIPEGGSLIFDLNWESVTTDVEGKPEEPAGYRIHFGPCPGEYTNKLEIGKVTAFKVDGITPQVDYYFAVTAFDRAGNESDFSNEVKARKE